VPAAGLAERGTPFGHTACTVPNGRSSPVMLPGRSGASEVLWEILENASLDEEMAFCRSKTDGFQQ
jgi:hypothetical protein